MAKHVVNNPPLWRRPPRYHGNGSIQGGPDTGPPSGVQKHHLPAFARVHLLADDTLRPIQTAMAIDGDFAFTHLNAGIAYLVIAKDPLASFNALIVDRLTPVVE